MVLDQDTKTTTAAQPVTFQCNSCPYDVTGTSWSWLNHMVGQHTGANPGHVMGWPA